MQAFHHASFEFLQHSEARFHCKLSSLSSSIMSVKLVPSGRPQAPYSQRHIFSILYILHHPQLRAEHGVSPQQGPMVILSHE